MPLFGKKKENNPTDELYKQLNNTNQALASSLESQFPDVSKDEKEIIGGLVRTLTTEPGSRYKSDILDKYASKNGWVGQLNTKRKDLQREILKYEAPGAEVTL